MLINVVLLLCEEKLDDVVVKTLWIRKESKHVLMIPKLTRKQRESQYSFNVGCEELSASKW